MRRQILQRNTPSPSTSYIAIPSPERSTRGWEKHSTHFDTRYTTVYASPYILRHTTNKVNNVQYTICHQIPLLLSVRALEKEAWQTNSRTLKKFIHTSWGSNWPSTPDTRRLLFTLILITGLRQNPGVSSFCSLATLVNTSVLLSRMWKNLTKHVFHKHQAVFFKLKRPLSTSHNMSVLLQDWSKSPWQRRKTFHLPQHT